MKLMNFKKTVLLAVASTMAISTVAPSVGLAQERQTLAPQQNLKGITDDARSILDTEQYIIKAIAGVDIADVPLLQYLFPKKEGVDYERIAREVSKAIKEAFVENNVFDQQSRLEATVVGLQRYVKVGKQDDNYLVNRLDRLDDIMARTQKEDLRLPAIGYYASAAQVSLGVMALRKALDPKNKGLQDDIWESTRLYRKNVNIAMQLLRSQDYNRIAREDFSECLFIPMLKTPYAYADKKTGQLFYFNEMNSCQSELSAKISARAQFPEFLFSLHQSWRDAEVALLGGEDGLKAYKTVSNPETMKKLGLPIGAASFLQNEVLGTTDPAIYSKTGSICNAIGSAIIGGQYYKQIPAGNGPREALLREANCPANSGPLS